MADSTSHSFFILFFGRGVGREAHIQSASRTCKPDLSQIVLVLDYEGGPLVFPLTPDYGLRG
jgi:hypothetical protein